ncbi:MAG: Mlc titration factor MtfA (ptsG expression regulator) [Myxococcota bacterium]|jgi:Mlc titration factor MtfA (ptsG expression regulator)
MRPDLLDRFFAWLPALEPRARKRQRLMDAPFPRHWRDILLARVPFWRDWTPALREEAEPLLQAFEGEQRWVGAGGLEVTEEMRVVISACATRPILRLDLELYDHLSEIVVYPYTRLTVPGHGENVLGVAHPHGVIVLTWPAVLRGLEAPEDGHDTALHEFVHALDMADGVMDGAPPLRSHEDYDPWARTLGARFDALQEGREHVLRPYGGESPAEFFAVASEHFFERPHELRQQLPDLHAVLVRFYGWDPGDPG